MRAYRVSKKCNDSLEDKIALIKNYCLADLLYVLRCIEANREEYDDVIVKGVVARLYDMGIMRI